MHYSIIILLILFILFIGVLFYAFVLFDRLLRAEYEQHRPAWETDGRPAGFFWRAKECRFITSHLARARLSFAWLFSTPAWVAGTSDLTSMLRHIRYAVFVWNVGILILFGMFLCMIHD
jgi:hypothetical protein